MFKDNISFGVEHFSYIYKEEDEVNVAKVVKITSFFPSFVDDLGNKNLLENFPKKSNRLYSIISRRTRAPT
jgi:sulfite reductase alpha subunit-like flavoprotein